MSLPIDRLHRGERWWPAEIVLRGLGLALLAGCGDEALAAHRMVAAHAPHPATVAEFAVCAVTFILLTAGLALTFLGPKLLVKVPRPPRPWVY